MSQVLDLCVNESLAHELFELQVSRAPQAPALRFSGVELCYAELNARANRLARLLRSRGVRREDRVIVCVDPSFDVIVALLALLKLGGVYVPLDPSYPEARLRAIIDDTQPRLVLTQAAIRERLSFDAATTLELDRLPAELVAESSDNLDVVTDPAQTAYVYYTSGTTGTPKGVLASHENLASYIGSARRRYGFNQSDVGLALARFSFSISMFELLSPLVSGGTLHILERAHILDFPRLSEALRQATFFHAGPSLLRGFLQYAERSRLDPSQLASVRHASSGGDMVPVEVLEGLLRVFPSAEVFVIYGCSEISCMGTTYPVPRGVPLTRSYVGRAFAGTTLRVVDEDLREVSSGVVGEVLFAGPGVVKGYLNRPQLTAEKFVEHDGLRFYRTGDRGRTNDEGLLELVGRSDFQIKLGGIRIELGEIEHHLRQAPGVTNGVVSGKTVSGETALVAYVVLEDGDPRPTSQRTASIRRYLAEQLPDYMVPGVYVALPALPLNHNSKIDRKALPEPPTFALDRASSKETELQSTTERRLARIWRTVLRVDRVERGDNFFELGGTSLLALQLLLEIDRELGVTLTGLEVLRESLAVQAQLCDHRAGREARLDLGSAPGESLEPFHFGPGRTLYGVLHGATSAPPDSSVLICGAVGHESHRAHFVEQRLARRLAARGVPALRFHYYGCGDSLGEPSEATLGRWQRDIVAAHQALQERTRSTKILGVGVRLGATLLSHAAQSSSFAKLVFWDPVASGFEHRARLLEAEARYRQAMPSFSLRERFARLLSRPGSRELLGATYSAMALSELSQLALRTPSSCVSEKLSTDCAWSDLARLEEMLPDSGISEELSRRLVGDS